ncbi:c-type cytochrome [Sphingobacterium corticibacterium]|uniref:Cytochrome c n=1 Tax=Sphingobacterium corticibacterium TaxID=2484746 RepID=A0A4Q6XHZ9_9SPHI|nr:cytochrome c [Sphingobacterium corticibacterium]RZF59273.1 cytochrome c [Sphingobacterium corticibacterium]
MKRLSVLLAVGVLATAIACNNNPNTNSSETQSESNTKDKPKEMVIHDYLKEGNKGIGPITSFAQPVFDQAVADEGNKLFIVRCTMCHEYGEDKLGPALKGITKKRTPEWILNLMLNTEEMFEKDPDALVLKDKYESMMVSVGLNEQEAKSILEYLRQEDAKTNL